MYILLVYPELVCTDKRSAGHTTLLQLHPILHALNVFSVSVLN